MMYELGHIEREVSTINLKCFVRCIKVHHSCGQVAKANFDGPLPTHLLAYLSINARRASSAHHIVSVD